MFRLVLIALVVYLIISLFRRAGKSARTKNNPSASTNATGEMISCAGCSTFVLKEQTIERNGERYCSENCADK